MVADRQTPRVSAPQTHPETGAEQNVRRESLLPHHCDRHSHGHSARRPVPLRVPARAPRRAVAPVRTAGADNRRGRLAATRAGTRTTARPRPEPVGRRPRVPRPARGQRRAGVDRRRAQGQRRPRRRAPDAPLRGAPRGSRPRRAQARARRRRAAAPRRPCVRGGHARCRRSTRAAATAAADRRRRHRTRHGSRSVCSLDDPARSAGVAVPALPAAHVRGRSPACVRSLGRPAVRRRPRRRAADRTRCRGKDRELCSRGRRGHPTTSARPSSACCNDPRRRS